MIIIHQLFFMIAFFVFLIPIIGYQADLVLLNLLFDLPILFILNVLLFMFFLYKESMKFRYQSIFLLILACVATLSSFLRIIPLPIGMTLAFFVPVSAAIVFGPSFGFIVGQLSMIISGVFLGAIGPWIPKQAMLMGITAYYAGLLIHDLNIKSSMQKRFAVAFVFVASFVYGFFMSISSWPIMVRNIDMFWTQGEKFRSYTEFYILSSFVWDLTRALGSIFIFAVLFDPMKELFERMKNKLTYYR
jgi:energy-coupling factor transport system substrate-specific component